MKPHVVIDANVVGAAQALGAHARVTALPGEAITRQQLRDADALLVRTATTIDAPLLRGTPVKFVGSATAGTDHVDIEALREAGIEFAHAPGCNARAVAEYVVASLLLAEQRVDTHHQRIGVVGLGNIGCALVPLLHALGREVHGFDPAADGDIDGLHTAHPSLGALLACCEAVSLHVPLTRHGPHPTAGLIGPEQLASGPSLFINTARGGVLDDQALLRTAGVRAVLDVFEDEPSPSAAIVAADGPAVVATPHIAGYSRQAKHRATEMVMTPLAARFGWTAPHTKRSPEIRALSARTIREAIAQACPLVPVESELRRAGGAQQFRHARRAYPLRDEFAFHNLEAIDDPRLAAALGFTVQPASDLT